MLDADADRAELELRLIKLLLKDRAHVHPFAGKGGLCKKRCCGQRSCTQHLAKVVPVG
ncbi:hypothetical protein [Bradyrhizobium sp. AZCC 2289]|uniref:hypothetical protein n=1 Tax=Bradyrhizobium sp. AZCC 2289 TaxID=3117026 RepID=UPI002FF2A7D4